jgi:hypothetical protein
VDGTGSGSCPVAGFGISGVEPSGCATRVSYQSVHPAAIQMGSLLFSWSAIHSGT